MTKQNQSRESEANRNAGRTNQSNLINETAGTSSKVVKQKRGAGTGSMNSATNLSIQQQKKLLRFHNSLGEEEKRRLKTGWSV